MCSYNLHCGRACLCVCVHVSHVLNRVVLFSNVCSVWETVASQRQWLVTYHGGWCHTYSDELSFRPRWGVGGDGAFGFP